MACSPEYVDFLKKHGVLTPKEAKKALGMFEKK
jgi:hypothetical protein